MKNMEMKKKRRMRREKIMNHNFKEQIGNTNKIIRIKIKIIDSLRVLTHQ